MATEARFAVRDYAGDALIGPGDIVELRERKISRFISGHGLVFVVSSTPLRPGNQRGSGLCLLSTGNVANLTPFEFSGDVERAHRHAIVLIGHAHVRCRGRVRAGDALLPSGLSDGTAVASQTVPSRIIAMESSQDGLGMILALISGGLPQIPIRAFGMQPAPACEAEFVVLDSKQLNETESAKGGDSFSDSTPRRCACDSNLHRQVFELRAENLALQTQVQQMRKTIAVAFRQQISEILACPLQSHVRAFLARRASARALRSALKLQAACRLRLTNACFVHMKRMALMLQSLARGHSAHRKFAITRKAAIRFQALARMRSDKKEYRHSVTLILRLQSVLRCASCYRKYIIAQDAVRLIQACARRSRISRTTALGRLLASLRLVAKAEDDLPSMIRSLEKCHVTAAVPIEQCACSKMASAPCESGLASASGGLTRIEPETCCIATTAHEDNLGNEKNWGRDRMCHGANEEFARHRDSNLAPPKSKNAERRRRVVNSIQEGPRPTWHGNPDEVVGDPVTRETIAAARPQTALKCSQVSISEHRAASITPCACASDGFDRALIDKYWRDTLTVGSMLDARLFGSKWYDSIVVGVDASKGVKVHFMGWSTKWDMSMLQCPSPLRCVTIMVAFAGGLIATTKRGCSGCMRARTIGLFTLCSSL